MLRWTFALDASNVSRPIPTIRAIQRIITCHALDNFALTFAIARRWTWVLSVSVNVTSPLGERGSWALDLQRQRRACSV